MTATLEATKISIIERIVSSDDAKSLEEIDIISSQLLKKSNSFLDNAYVSRVLASIKQAETGDVISQEDLEKETQSW